MSLIRAVGLGPNCHASGLYSKFNDPTDKSCATLFAKVTLSQGWRTDAQNVLQVVLGAMDLCCRALHTLKATTASLDVLEDVLWPGVEKRGQLDAPPPTTPKLLPSVHLFWAPLVAALQVILAIPMNRRCIHMLLTWPESARRLLRSILQASVICRAYLVHKLCAQWAAS